MRESEVIEVRERGDRLLFVVCCGVLARGRLGPRLRPRIRVKVC